MIKNKLQIEYVDTNNVKNYHRQLRKPFQNQITKTKCMIEESGGIITPIVIDKDQYCVIGQHLVEAARQLKIDSIPVVRADHLNEKQVHILRIAYDRVAEEAEWNKQALAEEFEELMVLFPDIDLTVTAFDIDEINLVLDILPDSDPNDSIPTVTDGPAVSQPNDLWIMGEHKLLCADAMIKNSYIALLGDEKVQMGFTDVPYNVKIDGHVGGKGKIQHREFVMGSGELTQEQHINLIAKSHTHMAEFSVDGAIHFSCIDWAHIAEMLKAANQAGMLMKNLCAWVKDNPGMGSLYRSQHELVFVFKSGTGKHINNIELGKNGRNRSNVWQYPGVNSFGGGRMNELEMHPTVKPVAMVADAIKDCSKRGGIILDPFGGSGTTLIAAEKTNRKARLIELDPLYCDTIIRRWQALTGENAVHTQTEKTFNQTLNDSGVSHD